VTVYGSPQGSPYGPPPSHGSPPPPPPKRSLGDILTKVLWGLFFLVVLGAIVQGATVQEIGFGPLTVSFGHKADSSSAGNTGSGTNPSTNTLPIGQPPAGNGSGNNGSGNDQPATSDTSVTVNRSVTRGDTMLQVSQVDIQDGHLLIHAKVTNNSNESISLPLYGYFVANDDKGGTYTADPFSSQWAAQVPAGGSITGTIQLKERVNPSATRLTISFTTIFGLGASGDGITLRDIPLR
jgi:hypothetical protein